MISGFCEVDYKNLKMIHPGLLFPGFNSQQRFNLFTFEEPLMKKLILSLCAVCFASTLTVGAIAQEKKPKPEPEAAFKKLDKDSDSKLSLAEFTGKREGDKAEMAKKAFEKKDKDKDGFLTLEEFKATPKKKNE